jgi:flagellar hook-basal body protein
MGSVDIKLPVGETVPAFATSNLSFTVNLDSTVTPPNDRYTSSIYVYDSLGDRHNVLITYEREGPLADNKWRYYVWSPDSNPPTSLPPPGTPLAQVNVVATADVVPPPPPPPPSAPPNIDVISMGVLSFGLTGLLDPTAVPGAIDDDYFNSVGGAPGVDNPYYNIAWGNGAAQQKVEWVINTGNAVNPNFTITQTATPAGTSNSSQNGYGAGTIKALTVDTNGFIIGTFTNGQTYPVARVALSIFTNNNGLEKAGENIWKETIASGPANVGCANDVGRGSVLGSHLEMSNVDVADEFTRLIITQRGYQANSRIVTTSDEMMQETLSLKR